MPIFIQKLTTLFVFLKIRMAQVQIVWSLIKILNICIIILKLLQKLIMNYATDTRAEQPINIIYNILDGGGIRIQVGITLSLLFCILANYFIVFFSINFSLHNADKKLQFVKVILYYPIVLMAVFQVFYCPITLYLLYCVTAYFQQHNSLSLVFMVTLVLSVLLYLIITLFNFRNRFFSLLMPIILLMIQLTKQSLVIPILMSSFAVIFIYRQRNVINKCGYATLITVCAFLILDNFQKDENIGLIGIINISVSIIAICTIVILKDWTDLTVRGEKQTNQFIIECLKQLEQRSPQKMPNSKLIKLEGIFRTFMQNNGVGFGFVAQQQDYQNFQSESQMNQPASKTNQISQQKINKDKTVNHLSFNSNNNSAARKAKYLSNLNLILTYKCLKEIQYKQFIHLCDLKFKKAVQKNIQNSQYKKQHLLFRIYNKYRIQNTIDTISQFIDCKRYNSFSQQQSQSLNINKNKKNQHNHHLQFSERCSRKQVEFVIFQKLLAKQPDNQKVKRMIRMSYLQKQFANSSIHIFSHIHTFWEKITMEVLIQDYIQQNFYVLSSHIENLKQVLTQLHKYYKAQTQINILKMIMKLVQPYSVAKMDIQLRSADGEIKQDALLFFAVQNKNIVHASPTFLKLINCNQEEVIGSNISKIIPEEISKIFRFKQNQAIRQVKVYNAVPILCGQHEIDIYQANFKIQAEQNSGIQYFYFLKKFETDVELSYLYLSSIDLAVKYVNKQFYKIFHLYPSYIQTKLKKKQFFLNNIVTNINATNIVEQLVEKKNIKCKLSFKSLKYKQGKGSAQSKMPDKFIGYINLQNIFGTDLLVSIHTINIDDTKGTNFQYRYNTNLEQEQLQIWKQFNFNTLKQDFNQKLFDHKPKAKFELDQEINPQLDAERYCLIPNPYKQKIQQKQSQLSEPEQSRNYLTYSNCIYALTILLSLILIAILGTLIIYCIQQDNIIGSTLDNFNKVSKYPLLLVRGTSSIYERYFLCDRLTYFTSFFDQNNVDFNNFVQVKIKLVKSLLAQFRKAYTDFYNRQIFKNVKYTLNYQYYKIDTDYSTANLLEYSYNIQIASQFIRVQHQIAVQKNISLAQAQQSQHHPLQFLVDNYLILSSIEAPYHSMNSLLSIQLEILKILKIVIGSLGVLMIAIMYFVSFRVKGILVTIKKIFFIFTMIDKQKIKDKQTQLLSSLEQYLIQSPKDTLKKLADLIKQKQHAMVHYQSQIRSYFSRRKKEQQKASKKIVLSNKDQLNWYTFQYMKILNLIIFSFLLLIGSFLYKLELDLSEDKIILKYFQQIQYLKFQQVKQSADMFHYNILRKVFNKTIDLPAVVQNKKSSVDKYLSSQFQTTFYQFFAEQTLILKQNLCQTAVKQQIMAKLINCQLMGLGILEKGFIQTSEYFDYYTSRLKNANISLFEINQSQLYPNMLIHIYVRQKIINQLTSLSEILEKMRQQFRQKYKADIFIFGTVGFSIICLLGIYLYIFFKKVKKLKNVAIGYFKIIPKQSLEKMEVSSYLYENKLLDSLSSL